MGAEVGGTVGAGAVGVGARTTLNDASSASAVNGPDVRITRPRRTADEPGGAIRVPEAARWKVPAGAPIQVESSVKIGMFSASSHVIRRNARWISGSARSIHAEKSYPHPGFAARS